MAVAKRQLRAFGQVDAEVTGQVSPIQRRLATATGGKTQRTGIGTSGMHAAATHFQLAPHQQAGAGPVVRQRDIHILKHRLAAQRHQRTRCARARAVDLYRAQRRRAAACCPQSGAASSNIDAHPFSKQPTDRPWDSAPRVTM
ncbi:hypothetical protein G6F54_013810 [Rhizopus delemar]|nr:hypothetical protein G6F54_013810 [Rhizopus delemar]